MGGMNNRLRIFAYNLCAIRDGEKCFVCNKQGNKSTLIVHHLDNNHRNNPRDGSNWKLACRHDNYILNPRNSKKVKPYIDINTSNDRDLCSPEMKKNMISEPLFRHWLYKMVIKNKGIPKDEAVNAGAEIAGCSPVTIKQRYLPKLLSAEGIYTLDDTSPSNVLIIFKPKHLIGVMPTDNGILDLIAKEDDDQ